MSGSVSPFTGANPADIVMLYNTWNPKPEMIADDQERADAVLGQLGRLQTAQDDEQIEPQRDQDAEEPVLLGQHGKHEVVVRDRQEPVAALRALPESLARTSPPDPTVTLA